MTTECLERYLTTPLLDYTNSGYFAYSISTKTAFRKRFTYNMSNTSLLPVFNNFNTIKKIQAGSSFYSIPLEIYKVDRNSASGDTIIKKLFYEHSCQSGLCKVQTSKGETYYGTHGILLDENFNILFMMFYELDEAYHKKSLIIKISPLVFTNSGTLEKTIIKKVIPIFLNGTVKPTRGGSFTKDDIFIHIEEIPKYVEDIPKPNTDNMNHELNAYLKNSLNN